MNSVLWRRTAILSGAALAALAFAFHTRMTWLYFQPSAAQLKSLLPVPGPLFFSSWMSQTGRLAAAALFFLSLPGLGALCLPRKNAFPPFTAAGLGLLLWGAAGFFMAAAGLSRPAPLRIASLILSAAGLISGFRRGGLKPPSFLSWGFYVFAGLYLLTTIVPDTFYDALVYHLAAPQAWLQSGRMTDMPDVHLWRLPGLMQPLYLWALAWSDDRLCKILNLGIALMAGGQLGRWAGDRWGREAGVWAGLLFISAPMVGVNLWSCANDIPTGFFCFLSLTLWLDGWAAQDRRRLFLAGLFLGAGASVKSTALFAAPFFFFDALRRGRPAGHRETLPVLALFGSGFVLPLLPWWIRTGLWTGNPFFPQAARLLGGDRPENIALLDGWRAEAGGPEGLFHRSLSLIRESLRGVEEGRFGFLGPVLLMLLPLAFFMRADPATGSLAAYALVAYAVFISATGRLRYFLPHLPPLFALAGLGLKDYAAAASTDRLGKNLGKALRVLAGAAVALNLFWLVLAFDRFNQGWPVVWGRQPAAGYLREEHIGVYGHPSQGAFDWLTENKAAGRLFIIGDARTFRSPLPARAAGSFNVPPYVPLAGEPPSPEHLLAALRDEGFTHLLINVEEMKRITPGPAKTLEFLQVLGTLFDRLAPPLYRDRWCILFKIPEAR